MQFPPRNESKQTRKPQNINNQISNPEIPSRELHAKFLETRDPAALWRDLTTTNQGELHDTGVQHADDTPPEGFM